MKEFNMINTYDYYTGDISSNEYNEKLDSGIIRCIEQDKILILIIY